MLIHGSPVFPVVFLSFDVKISREFVESGKVSRQRKEEEEERKEEKC